METSHSFSIDENKDINCDIKIKDKKQWLEALRERTLRKDNRTIMIIQAPKALCRNDYNNDMQCSHFKDSWIRISFRITTKINI